MFLLSVKLTDLPLEMVEDVLMRAFLMLYSSDSSDTDEDCCSYQSGKSRSSERRAYRVLSSVCWRWWQTLDGWPDSPTPHWLKHKTKHLIEREYTLDSLTLKHFTMQGKLKVSYHRRSFCSSVSHFLFLCISLSIWPVVVFAVCFGCTLFITLIGFFTDNSTASDHRKDLSLNWPIGCSVWRSTHLISPLWTGLRVTRPKT